VVTPSSIEDSPLSSPPPFSLTSSCSHTLRNLENESVYDVRVEAINRLGSSNYSKVFNFYVKTTPAVTDFASPRFLQTETKKKKKELISAAKESSSGAALLLLLALCSVFLFANPGA